MLTIHPTPGIDIGIFPKHEECLEVAAVTLTGLGGQPAFKLEVPYEFVYPVRIVHNATALVALQSTRDEIAKTCQKVDTHAGMEAISIAAANRQKTNIRAA